MRQHNSLEICVTIKHRKRVNKPLSSAVACFDLKMQVWQTAIFTVLGLKSPSYRLPLTDFSNGNLRYYMRQSCCYYNTVNFRHYFYLRPIIRPAPDALIRAQYVPTEWGENSCRRNSQNFSPLR